LILAVVLQFLLAASGAFDTAPKDASFQPHRALGYGILLFAVLLMLISALARMPGLIGMAGLTFLQGVTRAIAARSTRPEVVRRSTASSSSACTRSTG
jgi:hypothetical protein